MEGVNVSIFCFMMIWLLVLASASKCSRKLATKVLCPSEEYKCSFVDNDSYVNLVHTQADGANDTIHYLYSTYGIPSALIVRTELNAQLQLNMPLFLNHSDTQSISFNGAVEEAFVVVFAQLIDYADLDDSTNFVETNNHTEYDLSAAKWMNASLSTDIQSHRVQFRLSNESTSPKLETGGELTLTFQAFCDRDFIAALPMLQYTENSSVVDVVLDRVKTQYPQSRLALKLILVSDKNVKQNMSITNDRSIDDEHSPGSFVTVNWMNSHDKSTTTSYMQWKPACFNQAERSMQKSLSRSRYYDLTEYNFTESNSSLALDYFGHQRLITDRKVNIFMNHISFGLSGDKFYNNTAYMVWSFSFGLGTVPHSDISAMIYLIIFIGLGIPAVLLIAAGIFKCVRRHRAGYENLTGYSEIN